jgi:hypothetical protein
LQYWVWGSDSSIWFHIEVVWGRFKGKIEYGTLGDEKPRVESSMEAERDEKSGENSVVIEIIE